MAALSDNPESTSTSIARLQSLVDRLRPAGPADAAAAERRMRDETARLRMHSDEAATLGADLLSLLALPHQGAFYAETGVRTALGFWLELTQRLGQRLLPPMRDEGHLRSILHIVFPQPADHLWVAAVSDESWLQLARAIGIVKVGAGGTANDVLAKDTTAGNLLEASRMLSYRIAGAALDRELLRADPALERHESPFLAQNAVLVPLLERACSGAAAPDTDEVGHIGVLLDQCNATLDGVRRKACENGISIRLTYLLARLRQLIDRLRLLLDLGVAADPPLHAVALMKILLVTERTRDQVGEFVGENISLLARNITDHASRHGEHYVAEDRADWWAMAKSAAGGGIVIAIMAMFKVQLALLHLPPLTEGVAFGLNYGIGFVLIHLLGFTVATKQPAMTAASIAATLEDSRPKELERLGDFAQNVARTQFVAVLGNVGLALPVAAMIAALWPYAFGHGPAPAEKLHHMLHEVHPLASGALFFAAVAGVGLFLSGLVSGYFDNQARYHQLGPRIAVAPRLAWLGQEQAARLGNSLDAHYGAILGNLFFGMYLGLVGVLGNLTGLPVDIRHVAFSSANLGTALATLGPRAIADALPWAIAGVIAIALVNLAVSFALALYVAMQSRRVGPAQIPRLGVLLLKRLAHDPLAFISPPRNTPPV
jgi:site-specific recombinase